MAGGIGSNQFSKNQKFSKLYNNAEVLKDSGSSAPVVKKPEKFSLSGILGLNQTVEFTRQGQNIENKTKEVLWQQNHLETEQKILFDQHQQQLTKELESLREEISNLAQSTQELEKDIDVAIHSPVVEINDYEISFLARIKNFIVSFRKNIDQAGLWVESFTNKKKKKNSFWGKVKNKKNGGEQYLFSSEHSMARSVS